MTGKTLTTLLSACAVFVMAACDPHSIPPADPGEPDETIPFMGTRAERAARAPYSPLGWPLQRGDLLTLTERRELWMRFGSWHGIRAPFFVGDKVFGALIVGDIEASRAATDRAGHGRTVLVSRYYGHFSQKARFDFGRSDLPSYLRGEDLAEMKRRLYSGHFHRIDAAFRAEMLETWTADRWLEGYTGDARLEGYTGDAR